jgi:NADH:ubiquinone oxidoreductase subunit C
LTGNTKIIYLINLLKLAVPNSLKYIFLVQQNIFITLKTHKDLTRIISFLQKHTNIQATSLVDLCVIDYPERILYRYELNYNLISYKYNIRFFIRVHLQTITIHNSLSDVQSVPSLTKFFRSANWLEREAWDCFGIIFLNHPDLRRILTDYGFKGFPFRKDFPLTGYEEIRYNEEQKNIITEPLSLEQEFRLFEFHQPWIN